MGDIGGGGKKATHPRPAVDCDQEKEVRIPQGRGEGSRQTPPPQVCQVSSVHSFSLLALSTPLDPHSEGPVGFKKLEDKLLVKSKGSWEMGKEVIGARVNLGMQQDPEALSLLVPGWLSTLLATPCICSAEPFRSWRGVWDILHVADLSFRLGIWFQYLQL